jgi:protein-S-isoprenylcysteine O-methyltransferase Ste14
MNLISEPGLGIFLLVVLSLQGGVMLACTGRFPQIKPERQGIVMMENCFNTAILLLFIPLIGVLLLTGYYPSLDLTRLTIGIPWLIYGLEAIGISLVLYGTALVVFGLLALRKTFQPGGFAPRSQDRLITWRIYSFVRHPLNAGVLAMVLGIALMVQSLFVIALFIIYLILVLPVISIEEKQLSEVFGEEYRSYSQKVKRLVPFIY